VPVALLGAVLLLATYLGAMHGDSYRDYTASVGRFVPWSGVIH